jgi:hypothetical protein
MSKARDVADSYTDVEVDAKDAALQTQINDRYTKAETDAAVASLVDSSPETLNTLNELAAALGDDPNFATTMTNTLAGKVDNSQVLTNVPSGAVFTDTVYTHPSYNGDDFSVDTGALAGATVISDLDFNVTTDTQGHVTDANATYSTRNLTYSDVGAAPASHSHSYLPLSGGTITGRLVLPDSGYSIGNEYHTWKRSYKINNTSPANLVYHDGTELDAGGAYRFHAHIAGTGTDQSATAVFWNQNGTWKVNVTYQSGTSSNHPEFIIGGSPEAPQIHIDHTSNYTVEVLGERLELSEGAGTDNLAGFGTDAFLGSVGGVLRYNNAGSANNYSQGNQVFHDGYHPNADKWTTARTLNLTGDVTGSVSWDGSGNASLTATVADDSHNHTIANVDGLQTALDSKLNSTSYTAADVLTKIKTVDGAGSGLDADLLDGYNSSRFMRRTGKRNAIVGGGWMTVATCGGGRFHGEIIVTDADSSDHAFIRIDWMRSYIDSNFTVLNCGGHTNRIQGARVLYNTSDNTYGTKYLQVYVTANSNYEVNVYELGDIADYGVPSVVTPVIQNSISGYAVHGNEITGLDTYGHAAEEGIIAGGPIRSNNSMNVSGNTVWHAGNDGAGSGLDADKLDGLDSSAFAPASHTHNELQQKETISYGASTLQYADRSGTGGGGNGQVPYNPTGDWYYHLIMNHRNSSGYYSDLALSFHTNNHYINRVNSGNRTTVKLWTDGNDGAGSGLDADTVDGIQASQFLRSDTNDTMSGRLTVDTPADYDNTVITSMTNAPIYYPEVNVGTTNSFLPAFHMRSLHSSGYRTHMNVGLYKNTSGWGEGETGFYVGLGGNDSYPTEYFRMTKGGNIKHSNGYTFWHSGNDGAGSGLDADTVDGTQLDQIFAYKSATTDFNTMTSPGRYSHGPFTSTNAPYSSPHGNLLVWGSGSSATNRTSQLFNDDGGNNLHFRSQSWNNTWSGWKKIWHSGNDGSGSGLDADTLDGLQASQFLRSDTNSNRELATNSNSSSYSAAAIELREYNKAGSQTGAWSEAPRLAFHWGGRVAASIALSNDSDICIMNNLGTGYEDLRMRDCKVYGTVIESSDARLKENVRPITNALDKVTSLQGVHYNKIESPDNEEIGFVAQEVEEVVPELVTTDETEDAMKAVSYGRTVALLVEAMKEQQAQIEELKLKLKEGGL